MTELAHEALRVRLEQVLRSDDEAALHELLEELQPYDVASVLPEFREPDQLHLLTALEPIVAAEALEHLEPDEQYDLMVALDPGTTRDILMAMGDDAIADLVSTLHPREARRLLRHVPESDVAKVRALMAYPETSAGGRMTTGYFTARRRWTAQQVIEHFRRVGEDIEVAHYVYVVDRDGRLVGVTSLRDILINEPETTVAEFMHEMVVSVRPEDDQEDAARLLAQYDFGAIPVVGGDGKMLGVLTADDIIDVAEEEATEDIQKTAAVEPLDTTYSRASVWGLYRRRIGWLGILVLLNLLSGGIIVLYEDTLARAIVLAPFIPLLIGSGGNTGSQSATLMIRALATQDIDRSDWLRAFAKETTVGALLGFSLGMLAGTLGVFRGGPEVGLVVGLAMVVVVLLANLVGMALPFVLSLLRLDPAVASSPLIATVSDVTGLFTYFAIASWILV